MAEISPKELAKFAAAERSVRDVEDGMKLGLGTGSTAAWMVRCLANRVAKEGLQVVCVPTSERTATQARALGLTVTTLDEAGWLDLTIDGADEFDPDMNLLKGGGGAHLREKIVAAASDRLLVITDPSKKVAQLGAYPLPIEVIPFGIETTVAQIALTLEDAGLAGRALNLRMSGVEPFRTDQNNYVIDAALEAIPDPAALSLALNQIPGVVETGLFLGLCNAVVIGHADGQAETLFRSGDAPEFSEADPAMAMALPG
ncbi:MAG: ribose-5-phosphate isomerase RpiA [Pseudomonadota bacterium]